jgi:hypothetical protein
MKPIGFQTEGRGTVMTALSLLLGVLTAVFLALWIMERKDRIQMERRNIDLWARIAKLNDRIAMDTVAQKASEWRQEKREGFTVEEEP